MVALARGAVLPSGRRPRALAVAFLILVVLQAVDYEGLLPAGLGGGGTLRGATPAGRAARDASDPAAGTPDVCQRAAYPACWRWRHSRAFRALRPVLYVVGNELYQQLPTVGYGGIEASVDTLAGAMASMGLAFTAIVPSRRLGPGDASLPFRVLETDFVATGRGGGVGAFVNDVKGILEREVEADAEADAVAAVARRPHIAWGQSDWSQNFAGLVDVQITSHHDGGGPQRPDWDFRLPNVVHRFLSVDQRSRWTRPGDDVYNRTRIIPHGLNDDAFVTCPDGGYFLWVAGFGWGWEGKGLHIFVEMARLRPSYTFVAYGSGSEAIAARLRDVERSMPNFSFRGPLLRGANHTAAFCGASAFVMPTHEAIGESFGLTVIESLSKGVPVIASTNGAVPEILDVPGRVGVSPYGTTCRDIECYVAAADRYATRSPAASAAIQAYTRARFDERRVVDALLNFTIAAMEDMGIVPRE
jgi:hypothetical protein